MLLAAIQQGWLDEKAVVIESLLAIKRATRRRYFKLFRGTSGTLATASMKHWKLLLFSVLVVALSGWFLAIMRPPGARSTTPGLEMPWQN